MEFSSNQYWSINYLCYRIILQMKINPTTVRYYEEYARYLTKMRDKTLYDDRVDHQQHLDKLKIENMQRARELDNRLGQNIDITI